MHILFIITSLSSGGAERVTTNLANEWIRKGLKVTIITIASTTDDFYQVDPRINRIGLSLNSNSSNPIQAIVFNIKRIVALRRELRRSKPNVAIAMMPVSAVLTIIASFGLKNKVIACERNFPPMSKLNLFWKKLREITYPKATYVTAQTNEIADWIRENIKINNVEVIPNPILYPLPNDNPQVKPHFIIPENRKLILAVGRLEYQKGFDLLISVFSRLEKKKPDWDLVILGEGKLRKSLENLIEEKKLQDRIFLPGRAGNISDWYYRSDIYVMSSRFEGFPNTLAEAMAHSCTVLSYNCPTGPSDLIINNKNGVLVSPVGSMDTLENKLLELIENESIRNYLSKNAVDVRITFSIDKIMMKWNKLIEHIV